MSLRDKIAAYADEMQPLNPLDIIERAFERSGVNNDGDDKIYRWIDPVHIDSVDDLPDPLAEAHARAEGINTGQILNEKVGLGACDHISGGSDKSTHKNGGSLHGGVGLTRGGVGLTRGSEQYRASGSRNVEDKEGEQNMGRTEQHPDESHDFNQIAF